MAGFGIEHCNLCMRCGTEAELGAEFGVVAARGIAPEIQAGAIRSICEFGKRRRLEAAPVCGVQMCIFAGAIHQAGDRSSEEHTSELQSLIRNSYGYFCFRSYY